MVGQQGPLTSPSRYRHHSDQLLQHFLTATLQIKQRSLSPEPQSARCGNGEG